MFKHDVDADLSHNAIPLRRIYALNNGNKADDIRRSRHSDRHPAEEYNYPAATAIASIMVLLSFATLLVVDLVQSWSPNATADVTGVSSAGSDTAGQRTAGRALPDGSRVLVA